MPLAFALQNSTEEGRPGLKGLPSSLSEKLGAGGVGRKWAIRNGGKYPTTP